MAKRKSQKRRNQKYQANNRQLKAKRSYNDTIFRMLYHDKENLLSLYNTVNGKDYTDPEELQIVVNSGYLLHMRTRQKILIWN